MKIDRDRGDLNLIKSIILRGEVTLGQVFGVIRPHLQNYKNILEILIIFWPIFKIWDSISFRNEI